MTRIWWAIAKAEFLVRTSRLHRARKTLYPLLIAAAVLWASVILPRVFSLLLSRWGDDLWLMLSTSLPGFVRSIMFAIWMFVLVIPLSNSLENVKTDQWEILFSAGVRTRDILLGSFLGKLPVTGLLVAFLAPLVIHLFAYSYAVSALGQVVMVAVLMLFAVSTIWLSNVLSTALQAKIGESPRGDDLGKALSWGVVPIAAIPVFSVVYWAGSITQTMATDLSMLLPSTWCADVLTWIAMCTGNLPASSVMNLELHWLSVSPLVDVLLLVLFVLLLFTGGIRAADSVFAYGAGPAFRKIAHAGPDGIVLRTLRGLIGGSFGVIVATSLKDYVRKLQNVAKIAYGLFMAVLMAIVIAFGPFRVLIDEGLLFRFILSLMMSMMLGMLSGVVFGGVGLFDSKDQLWIVKSVPSGVSRFILARTGSYALVAVPYAFIPPLIAGVLLNMSLADMAITMIYVYAVVCAAAMIGIGITALNPSYETASSSSFTINTVATIAVSMALIIVSLFFAALPMAEEGALDLGLGLSAAVCISVGLVVVALGTLRLNRSEAA